MKDRLFLSRTRMEQNIKSALVADSLFSLSEIEDLTIDFTHTNSTKNLYDIKLITDKDIEMSDINQSLKKFHFINQITL
jgi:hypothetical protein